MFHGSAGVPSYSFPAADVAPHVGENFQMRVMECEVIAGGEICRPAIDRSVLIFKSQSPSRHLGPTKSLLNRHYNVEQI